MNHIYLDNSATTQVCREAADKALELMTQQYGNPSSLHALGFGAEQELSAARQAIADALQAKSEEIFFTSGGTEANNLAIFGAVEAKKRFGKHIVTTQIEHPSVLGCMAQLEKQGYSVTYLEPDTQGKISAQQVADAIGSETILVSMMLVNNEVGTILPVEAAAKAISRKKAPALLHVDAVQGFGKISIKPKRMRIDLLSVSSHKIHGPKGVGALYLADGVRILPRLFGGGQEKGLRPGTEALPLIGAFGAAVRALPRPEEGLAAMQDLADYCREKLEGIPGVVVNSPADSLPYLIHFSTHSVRSETMLHFLSAKGIFVSSGSACSKAKASHVLTAMKLPRAGIHTALRVSFSRWNQRSDIDQLIDALQEGMETLAKDAL